jgi:hypothetical protein
MIARVTQRTELGLQAAAYVAGHKSTETAARRYVLPKQREARAALERLAAKDRTGHKPGTWTIEGESEFTIPCDSWQTRRDSNPCASSKPRRRHNR